MNQKIKGTYAMQLNHSDFAVTLKITLALHKMTTTKETKTKKLKTEKLMLHQALDNFLENSQHH